MQVEFIQLGGLHQIVKMVRRTLDDPDQARLCSTHDLHRASTFCFEILHRCSWNEMLRTTFLTDPGFLKQLFSAISRMVCMGLSRMGTESLSSREMEFILLGVSALGIPCAFSQILSLKDIRDDKCFINLCCYICIKYYDDILDREPLVAQLVAEFFDNLSIQRE